MSANRIGSFDLDRARQTYQELGPLTKSDLYRLIRQSDKKRRESLQVIYGFHGAKFAETEYRRMAKEL